MNGDYSRLEQRVAAYTWPHTWSGAPHHSSVHLSATARVLRLRELKAKACLDPDDAHEVRMVAYGLNIPLDLPWSEVIDRSIEALVPKVIAERLLK